MVSTIDRTCGLLVSDVHGRVSLSMPLQSCVTFAIPCTDFQAFGASGAILLAFQRHATPFDAAIYPIQQHCALSTLPPGRVLGIG